MTNLHQFEHQTIHRWINEYKQFGKDSFLDNSFITREQDLNKLKRQNKLLKKENEILIKIH